MQDCVCIDHSCNMWCNHSMLMLCCSLACHIHHLNVYPFQQIDALSWYIGMTCINLSGHPTSDMECRSSISNEEEDKPAPNSKVKHEPCQPYLCVDFLGSTLTSMGFEMKLRELYPNIHVRTHLAHL